jgi:hypothetical protein
MSQDSDSSGENPLGCLLVVGILWGGYMLLRLLLAIHEATWPIWFLLGISGLGWYLAAKRTKAWAKVHASILMPVTVGLGFLFMALLALNLGKLYVSEEALHRWESSLIDIRLRLNELLDLRLPVFLTIMAVAIALGYLIPRLRAVSFALWMQKAGTAIYIFLLTVTSFTFFSQIPLQDLVEEEHERNKRAYEGKIERYDFLLREEAQEVGDYLAAQTFRKTLEEIDESIAASYREAFQALDSSSREEVARHREEIEALSNLPARNWQSSISREAAESLARSHAAVIAGNDAWSESRWAQYAPEAQRSAVAWNAEIMRAPPESLQERESQLDLMEGQARLLEEQAKRTRQAQERASQVREGLTAAFSEAVDLGVPELRGLVGVYVEALVGQLSESLFQRMAESWYREGRPQVEVGTISEQALAKVAAAVSMAGLLRAADIRGPLGVSIATAVRSLVRRSAEQLKASEIARIERERRAEVERQRVREAEIARRVRRTYQSRSRGK